MNGVKCNACKEYQDVLRAMHVRFRKKSSMEERTQISSKINHRYLDAPELTMRMSRLKTKLDESRRQIEQLKKIDQLTQSEGIVVDEAMDRDLQSIMNEETK